MKTEQAKKAEKFIDYLQDNSITDCSLYPYDEITHGIAIGILSTKLRKTLRISKSGEFITDIDYWEKIHKRLLSMYKKANAKLPLDILPLNKLITYVMMGFNERDSSVKKTSIDVQQAIIYGIHIDKSL